MTVEQQAAAVHSACRRLGVETLAVPANGGLLRAQNKRELLEALADAQAAAGKEPVFPAKY